MNKGGKVRGVAAVMAVVSVLGAASAQESTAPATASPQQPGEADQLSPAQMVAAAKALLPAMDKSAAVVRRQLTLARQQKDVVKALCLNDKLNQVDLATRTATDRVSGLEAAATANDAERSRHQYTVVLVLNERVNTLVSEANQCIGEETGFVGESIVTVQIEGVPDVDPSEHPTTTVVNQPPVVTIPEPPSPVSPSMPDM
jgi:hypothetical protein